MYRCRETVASGIKSSGARASGCRPRPMINDTLKSSTAETVEQRCGVKLPGGRRRRKEGKKRRNQERKRGREKREESERAMSACPSVLRRSDR